jgi:hypothetical protein
MKWQVCSDFVFTEWVDLMALCRDLLLVGLTTALVCSLASCSSDSASSGSTEVDAVVLDANGGIDIRPDIDDLLDSGGDSDFPDADAVGSFDAGDGSGDTNDGADAGLPTGEICAEDSDCQSGECVDISGGDDSISICTDLCAEDANCPDGTECVLVLNSGSDAERICLPTEFCFDPDEDGYGIGNGCRGSDCSPLDAEINPAADESCNGIDDDCDDRIDESAVEAGLECDTGFDGVCSAGVQRCSGGALQCEQQNSLVDEICDGLDNDCDGEVDEGSPAVAPLWYRDTDSDAFGDPADFIRACAQPEGYVDNANDCDDSETDVNPAATEICDEIDNNCNNRIDEADAEDAPTWYADTDEDGYGNLRATRVACVAPDGYVADSTDCNDGSRISYPGAVEICDSLDNDCDTEIDEGSPTNATAFYADTDEDSFGDPASIVRSCVQPLGYVTNNRDCNDLDEFISPEGTELCDGVDNDCDAAIDEDDAMDALTWYADTDEDDYGNPRATREACEAPVGYVADATDCNDSSTISYPGAPEICDGLDNNCDLAIDEEGATGERVFYRDFDEDTFGDPLVTIELCRAPPGYVDNARDCDDTDEDISPDAAEVCDGVDNNCNRQTDEDAAVDAPTWYADTDRDTFGNRLATRVACVAPAGYVSDDTDCNDGSTISFPGATEICDSIDNDCDRAVDEAGAEGEVLFFADTDMDTFGDPAVSRSACVRPPGYVINDRDCNDSVNAINPNATEVCDGVDNNCDRRIDESESTDAQVWYADTDNDTYGNPGASTRACNQPAGYVSDRTDCNDSSEFANPAQVERCDGIDNDCDRQIDEAGAAGETTFYRDVDGDRYGNSSITVSACTAPTGYVATGGDCNDGSTAANPGILTETCDGLDNNCRDGVDENLVRQCSTACGVGNETCSAGSWVGCSAPPVLPETCDRVDNNCDGSIDNGISCRHPVHRLSIVIPPAPSGPEPGLCNGGDRTLRRYLYSESTTEGTPAWSLEQANDFYVYNAPATGLVPLYRCYNSDIDRFFLTTSSTCELWERPAQGILGYVAAGPAADTVPLNRSVNNEVFQHFFTESAVESQSRFRCANYLIEGVGGHVWTTP